jgi:hypothetical protein
MFNQSWNSALTFSFSEEEEEEEGEYFSSSEVESMDENEIFQMLDENVKSTNENSVEEPPLVQYENIRVSLIYTAVE